MTTPPIRVLVVDDDYHVAGIHAAYVERTAVSPSSGRRTPPPKRVRWPPS